jgi:hypothetical protein
MPMTEEQEDICMFCSQWYTSYLFREYWGEGCGKCILSGDVTFCSHKCPFCDHKGGS